MAKRIVPFTISGYHETSAGCSICQQIDDLYDFILNHDLTEIAKQTQLKFLDDNFLINGYQLLQTLEKIGYPCAKLYYKQKIKKLKTFNSIHGIDNTDPNKVRLIHSRWCKNCGSRKPDIYDESREVDE